MNNNNGRNNDFEHDSINLSNEINRLYNEQQNYYQDINNQNNLKNYGNMNNEDYIHDLGNSDNGYNYSNDEFSTVNTNNSAPEYEVRKVFRGDFSNTDDNTEYSDLEHNGTLQNNFMDSMIDSNSQYNNSDNNINDIDDFNLDEEEIAVNTDLTRMKKFGLWIKSHKAITAIVAILFVAVIGFSTFLVINTKSSKKTKENGKDTQLVDNESTPLDDGIDENGDVNSEVESHYQELQDGSAQNKEINKSSVTDLSKVKTAPVDDTSDPQPKQNVDSESKSSGAVVNVNSSIVSSTTTDTNGDSSTASGATLGIDVSKWQGKIDWSKVAQSGINFAMIRIGYRTTVTGEVFEDPYATYNMQQAQKAGIKIGVYFYSTAVSVDEAKAEAEWVCKQIAQYKITYPVVFDYEGFDMTGTRNSGMDSQNMTDIAVAFMDKVKSSGYTPMIYASKSALTDKYKSTAKGGSYKVWVSQYPSTPYPQTSKSSYSGVHSMWQYTSKGQVSGINGYVDVNVAYFGYDNVAAAKDSTSPESVSINPEIGITFTSVNESVTPKICVNLRNAPNVVDGTVSYEKVQNGEVLTRTGIGDNGWSRVEYKGKTVYAVSSYLTTDLNDKSQVDSTTKKPQSSADEPSGSSLPSGYSAVSVQVTPKDKVNLRSKPTSTGSDTIVASVSNGDVLDKIAESTSGWSLISYNGQNVYAITSYLTTDLSSKPAVSTDAPATTEGVAATKTPASDNTYSSVNEQVTAKSETNLRSAAGSTTEDTIVYKLKAGEYVTRTGIGSNGWSRLEYNGQTVYAITSYLTTSAVSATTEPANTAESATE